MKYFWICEIQMGQRKIPYLLNGKDNYKFNCEILIQDVTQSAREKTYHYRSNGKYRGSSVTISVKVIFK